jgi:hypothetical protein
MAVIAAGCLGLWMWAEPSSAACLQKAEPGVGKVSNYVFMLAPESAVAAYLSLGFTRIDCPSDMSVIRSYVSTLCSGTGGNPTSSVNGEVAITNVPRAQSCKDAKAGLAEATGARN